MKKSLLALAAMGAFTGAAQAQSSVTVYGILDVGYVGGNARVSTPASGQIKETVNRFASSMESGSRLGFRGTEDLGGGTSAQFVFELGIDPAGTTTTQNWSPNIRQGFVGLTQKGLGIARIGTQNTLFWEQAGSNTAGQLSQTAGSMLAPTIVGPGFTSAGLADSNGAQSPAYTVRTASTLNLRTERMAGVVAKASYTLSNANRTQRNNANLAGYTGGTDNNEGWQVALDWNIAKANIQASYAAFTSENPYTATNAQLNTRTYTAGSPAAWVASAGLNAGVNVKDNQALVTASYDFGILKAYIGWTDRKVTSAVNTNVCLKRSAQEIGVRGYATKTIEYWGSIGNGRYQAFGLGEPTSNITGYQVGSNYWMSKRTNLYAIFGANNTSSSAAGTSGGVNQYSLGVRHTF